MRYSVFSYFIYLVWDFQNVDMNMKLLVFIHVLPHNIYILYTFLETTHAAYNYAFQSTCSIKGLVELHGNKEKFYTYDTSLVKIMRDDTKYYDLYMAFTFIMKIAGV